MALRFLLAIVLLCALSPASDARVVRHRATSRKAVVQPRAGSTTMCGSTTTLNEKPTKKKVSKKVHKEASFDSDRVPIAFALDDPNVAFDMYVRLSKKGLCAVL